MLRHDIPATRRRGPWLLPPLLVALGALSACAEDAPRAVGLLASDRVEIVAEAAEPIVAIAVEEGEQIAAGQLLVRQDDSRVVAREQEAQAAVARYQAVLAEQEAGPRRESIDAVRAEVQAAQVDLELYRKEQARLQRLGQSDLTSRESLDLATARVDASEARLAQARARLRELEAGTRVERLEQARQQLAEAQARLEQVRIDGRRLESRAPVPGRLDSLPFELGERPRAGDVIAVLLTGEQPHARVYVPESLRVGVAPGDPASVRVDGLATPLVGRVRRIATEASFTPYFSLTEHDRGRLSYVAEITLQDTGERLPDGVPVEVSFPAAGSR